MNRYAWQWAAFVTAGLLAGTAAAQDNSAATRPVLVSHPTTMAPGCATPAPDGTLPPMPSPGTAPSSGEAGFSLSSGLGEGLFQGNLSAAGTGLTSASSVATASTNNTNAPAARTIFFITTDRTQTPLILPGLFTSASAESARPTDRLFVDYGYFDRFKATGGTGFNLNTFDFGVEKTILDGRGSVYVRVPFLAVSDNTTGQPMDGIGDVNGGIKYALLLDRETGSALSAGLTVSAPTARDLRVTNNSYTFAQGAGAVPGPNGRIVGGSPTDPLNLGIFLPPATTTTINPTFLQPWVGGTLVLDRLFVQEYLGVIIPTDDHVATFINNNLGLGYMMYRAEPGRWLSSITPNVNLQLLVPVNHRGTPQSTLGQTTFSDANAANDYVGTPPASVNQAVSLSSPDQLFLTVGAGFGLGERALLSAGVVVPVVGPKAFDVGGTVSLNFFF